VRGAAKGGVVERKRKSIMGSQLVGEMKNAFKTGPGFMFWEGRRYLQKSERNTPTGGGGEEEDS